MVPQSHSTEEPLGATVACELASWFSRVGFLKKVVTDQGMHFMTEVLVQMWTFLVIQLLRSLAYHPQLIGLVELSSGALKGF